MKGLLIWTIPFLLPDISSAQADSSNISLNKNSLFVTFGGPENFGSLNYERIFSTRKKLNWSLSIGVQPFTSNDKFSLPVSISAFTKGAVHHVEFMLTGNFHKNKYHPWNGGWKNDFNKQLYVSPFICYRWQKNKGVLVKIGLGPHFVFDPPSYDVFAVKTRVLKPSVFASLGYSF